MVAMGDEIPDSIKNILIHSGSNTQAVASTKIRIRNTNILPFSDVSCFSAGRNIAAGNTAGSERPFVLNA